ncbi:hypothetical protein BDW62DRAFT_201562 [Aspergillus aurantiobrunneus]
MAAKDEVLACEIAAIERYNAAISQMQTHVASGGFGVEPDVLADALLGVYCQLSQDTATYHGNSVLEELASYSNCRVFDMGSGHLAFASCSDAWKALRRLDVIYDTCFASSFPVRTGITGPESQSQTRMVHDRQQTALRSARAAFQVWTSRFELHQQVHIQRHPHGDTPDHHHLLQLTLHRRIWALLTAMPSVNDAPNTQQSKTVLSAAESAQALVHTDAKLPSTKHPTFTLGSDLVPVLALICASSRTSRPGYAVSLCCAR